jgi:hypothetical protein
MSATSTDGINWSIPPHITTYEYLFKVIWANDQFIAVGTNGAIITSDKGLHWTVQDSTVSEDLGGIVWNNSQYVAVGRSGTIIQSPDGINWTRQESGTDETLMSIAWNGTMYVALNALSNVAITSNDGKVWTATQVDISQTEYIYDIVWTGDKFVAVGDSGYIGTSSDGINWIYQDSATTDMLQAVTWTGERLVAVGAQTILTSQDGVTWTQQNIDENGYVWIGDAISTEHGVYALSGIFRSKKLLSSPNGDTWTHEALPSSDIHTMYSIAVGNGRIVIAGSSGVIVSRLLY